MSQIQITGEAKIRDLQGPVVANSGVITALDGLPSQYVRGDGTLADIPSVTGGGASVSYYLNGSVSQGTFGGSTYYQLGENAITGGGTNFSTSTDGLIAQFITDPNVPDLSEIPSGNWNIEFYMGVSASSGAFASFYAELYKYDGTTFTLIASSVGTPEVLTNTTTVSAYFSSIAVPQTPLAVTDRIAIRVYASVAGKTVTMYTEDNRLCQVVTTFSRGMLSLNSLTDQQQYLTVGTAGTDFNIVSSVDTHTFNIPSASATNRGLITTGTQTIAGDKTLTGNNTFSANNTFTNDILVNGLTIGKGAGTILNNTAIGITALYLNTTGSQNTALGYAALSHNTTGENNIGIGSSSLFDNTTGYGNTGVGVSSLAYNTIGYFNTAIGLNSLASNTTGAANVALGISALYFNTTANLNTAIGSYALLNNTTGSYNTAIGASAMQSNSTGYINTAVGWNALSSNTIGFSNTGVGNKSLSTNSDGYQNTAVGDFSLQSNTTGFQNTALGSDSLTSNTTGVGNVAIGQYALGNSQTGNYNISIGASSGQSIVTGSYNTILGTYYGTAAMSNNIILADGQGNVRYQWDGTDNKLNGRVRTSTNILVDGGSILLKQGAGSASATGYFSISGSTGTGTGALVLGLGSGTQSSMSYPTSANYSYIFPEASGTIALTSNLSSYLPLIGGTLTGPLTTPQVVLTPSGSALSTNNALSGSSIGATYLNGGTAGLVLRSSGTTNSAITLVDSGSYIEFIAGASEKMRLTSAGSILLGTTSDTGERLQVNGTSKFTGALSGTSATFSGAVGIGGAPSTFDTIGPVLQINRGVMYSYADGVGLAANFRYESGDIYINSNYSTLYQQSTGEHRWFTAPSGTAGSAITFTQRMTLTNGGNLGINCSPNAQFEVLGATGGALTDGIRVSRNTLQNSQYGVINYTSGILNLTGVNTSGGGEIRLNTSDGTTTTERMRITSGGNVGIGSVGSSVVRLVAQGSGTSSAAYSFIAADSAGATCLAVRNDGLIDTGTRSASPYNFGTTGRTAVIESSGALGYLVSTRESKTNIETIESIDFINRLNPVQFNYRKKDNDKNIYTDEFYDNLTYGFIADEVEQVNKELVMYNQDGTLGGVEYNSMIAILTKAIQELTQKVNELESKIK